MIFFPPACKGVEVKPKKKNLKVRHHNFDDGDNRTSCLVSVVYTFSDEGYGFIRCCSPNGGTWAISISQNASKKPHPQITNWKLYSSNPSCSHRFKSSRKQSYAFWRFALHPKVMRGMMEISRTRYARIRIA